MYAKIQSNVTMNSIWIQRKKAKECKNKNIPKNICIKNIYSNFKKNGIQEILFDNLLKIYEIEYSTASCNNLGCILESCDF